MYQNLAVTVLYVPESAGGYHGKVVEPDVARVLGVLLHQDGLLKPLRPSNIIADGNPSILNGCLHHAVHQDELLTLSLGGYHDEVVEPDVARVLGVLLHQIELLTSLRPSKTIADGNPSIENSC